MKRAAVVFYWAGGKMRILWGVMFSWETHGKPPASVDIATGWSCKMLRTCMDYLPATHWTPPLFIGRSWELPPMYRQVKSTSPWHFNAQEPAGTACCCCIPILVELLGSPHEVQESAASWSNQRWGFNNPKWRFGKVQDYIHVLSCLNHIIITIKHICIWLYM